MTARVDKADPSIPESNNERGPVRHVSRLTEKALPSRANANTDSALLTIAELVADTVPPTSRSLEHENDDPACRNFATEQQYPIITLSLMLIEAPTLVSPREDIDSPTLIECRTDRELPITPQSYRLSDAPMSTSSCIEAVAITLAVPATETDLAMEVS